MNTEIANILQHAVHQGDLVVAINQAVLEVKRNRHGEKLRKVVLQ